MAELESFTKVIYNVTSRLTLKHRIKLGSEDRNGNRKGPIFLNTYQSNSYNDVEELTSVTINSSDYLILEYYKKENPISIFFSYPHLSNLKRMLKMAINWFYDDEYENMFIVKNDEIQFNSKFKEERLFTNMTIGGQTLTLKPAIIERDSLYQEGVLLILNNDESISLDVEELESLYNVVKNFDLYNSSLILLNYALTEHKTIMNNAMAVNNVTKKTNSADMFKKRKRIEK